MGERGGVAGPVAARGPDGPAPGVGRARVRHHGEVVARRAVVSGDVQGVGFRWWTAREAERLGVRGWVTNRWDGTVEVHAEGDEAAVDALVAALRHGPRYARVRHMAVEDAEPHGWVGFEVEP